MQRRLPEADERRLVRAVVTLGLVPPFTMDEARDRFRALAKIYHPDAGKNADSAAFGQISEAFATIEAHADLCGQTGLSFGRPGSAATTMAADLVKQLSEAEGRLVEKDAEIGRLRLQTELLVRHRSQQRQSLTAGWIIPVYLIVLFGAIVATVALVGRSETVVPLVFTQLPVEAGHIEVNQTFGEFDLSLGSAVAALPTSTTIRIRDGKAEIFPPATVSFACVSTPTLRGRLFIPVIVADIIKTRLDDPFHLLSESRTYWGWLREAKVRISDLRIEFDSLTTGPQTSEGSASIGGWIQVKMEDKPSPIKRRLSDWTQGEKFKAPSNVTNRDFTAVEKIPEYNTLTQTE